MKNIEANCDYCALIDNDVELDEWMTANYVDYPDERPASFPVIVYARFDAKEARHAAYLFAADVRAMAEAMGLEVRDGKN